MPPPKKVAKNARPTTPAARDLSDQLRDAIRDRGATAYELGKAADVDPAMITRFLSGERGIQLATAARLATALGLKLAEKAGRPGRPPSTKTARPLESA